MSTTPIVTTAEPLVSERRLSATELYNFLQRHPAIAKNKVHADKDFAITHCLGATDRVIPTGLIGGYLDEFICEFIKNRFGSEGILLLKLTSQFLAPICLDDKISFRVLDNQSRGQIIKLTVEVWRNCKNCAQTHQLTLALVGPVKPE